MTPQEVADLNHDYEFYLNGEELSDLDWEIIRGFGPATMVEFTFRSGVQVVSDFHDWLGDPGNAGTIEGIWDNAVGVIETFATNVVDAFANAG